MEGRHYVYRHIRLDKNVPFYVGIGTKRKGETTFTKVYSRAFVKSQRPKHWKNIVKNTEYKVQILVESDDYDEIKRKEIEFISLYRRRCDGGTLVNLTLGGEGTLGFTINEEQKRKLSESLKISAAKPEAKKKATETAKRRWESEGFRETYSKVRKGLKHKPEAARNKAESNKKRAKPVKDLLTNRVYETTRSACEHLGLDYPKEIRRIADSPRTRFMYLEEYDRLQREFTDN